MKKKHITKCWGYPGPQKGGRGYRVKITGTKCWGYPGPR
jgi:hypothetical protein